MLKMGKNVVQTNDVQEPLISEEELPIEENNDPEPTPVIEDNSPRYTKQQFVNSKIYSGRDRDIFRVVLQDGVLYTIYDAEMLRDNFLRGGI